MIHPLRVVRHLLPVIALFSSAASFAQSPTIDPCGNGKVHVERLQSDENYRLSLQSAEQIATSWIEKHPSYLKDNSSDKVVIPVVFHVVYNNLKESTERLTYEKMVEQIEVMNRDYNRYNRDRNRTRPIFDSIAGSVNIVFTLASQDPDGNPTNGVTYTSTTKKGFDVGNLGGAYTTIDSLKSTTGGGRSCWPTDRYLNIWVAHLTYLGSDGLYGIATFPGSAPANEVAGNPPPKPEMEGIAMFYQVISLSLNNNGDTLFAGRTLSHEVGHFLGLRHIWGDSQSNACDSSDYVYDTPQAATRDNFTCTIGRNECNNENPYWGSVNPPNMTENYMDYSGDNCYNMFSNGQIARMHSFLNTDRKGLWQNTKAGGKSTEQYKAWGYTDPVSGCSQDCDGKIEIYAQHGNEPYTYTVDGLPTGDKVEGLCSGLHTVIVRDAINQVVKFDLVVGAGNYYKPKYVKSKSNATCASCADGKAKVNMTNGRKPFTITWQVNPPVVNPQITGLSKGRYYFTVTDGCGIVYRDSVDVDAPSGIASISNDNFNLFPNPASNELKISFGQALEIRKVVIRNVLGAEVRSSSFSGSREELELQVTDLVPGSYAIELFDRENSRKTLSFIKN